MDDMLGKPRRRDHRCGNCIFWAANPSGLTGVCEIGDHQPLIGFDGNGVDTDQGFRTTPDSYCDQQVPIPPPGPTCPKCGTPTCEGYGLAGGGLGAYVHCSADACDYFEKFPEFGEAARDGINDPDFKPSDTSTMES